jgi:hypothetical protein
MPHLPILIAKALPIPTKHFFHYIVSTPTTPTTSTHTTCPKMRLLTFFLLLVPSLALAFPTAQKAPLTKTPGAALEQCVAHLGDCRFYDCCSGTECLPNYAFGNDAKNVSDFMDE